MLLKTVVSGKLHPGQLITHHFMLDEMMQAYDTFGDAMKESALKEIITNGIKLTKSMQATGSIDTALLKKLLEENFIVNDSLDG